MHDLLVMVYALRPDLFETRRLHVDVETQGQLTTGMTVADFRTSRTPPPNVDVCLGVDVTEVLAYYEKVIQQGCRRSGSA